MTDNPLSLHEMLLRALRSQIDLGLGECIMGRTLPAIESQSAASPFETAMEMSAAGKEEVATVISPNEEAMFDRRAAHLTWGFAIAWAATAAGDICRFDGAIWSYLSTGFPNNTHNALWGRGEDVWLGASGDLVLEYMSPAELPDALDLF